MSATQDFVALDWIKGEIGSTLDRAQQSLEAVAESADDSSSMRACLTHLHQVNGTLRMVNLDGPSSLAAEMEEVAQALMGNETPDVSRAQEVLMQAILQMPRYLDRIQREQKDDASMLRPLLNSLRGARGEAPLPGDEGEAEPAAAEEGDRLALLSANVADSVIEHFEAEGGRETVRKLRARYQQALVALLKKQNPRENLTLLGKVFTMLQRLCGDSPAGYLGLLGQALIEAVGGGAIRLNADVANHLKAIDAVLRSLAEADGPGLGLTVDRELGGAVLATLDGASKEIPRIVEVKERFKATVSSLSAEDENVAFGPDDETLSTVSRILIEELTSITDKLDIYVRSSDREVQNLVDLIPQLQQIRGTLAVVGLSSHMDSIANQVEAINTLQSSGEAPTEEVLLDIARALLEIESSLKSLVGDEDEGEGEGFGDVGTAEATVIKETRNGLTVCKDAVINYVTSDFDSTKVEELPAKLLSLRGSLSIVNQIRSADVLEACAAYVSTRLLKGGEPPELSDMDDLADAITSVDYFLERYLESPGDPYLQMIEVAEAAITKLGFEPGNLPEEQPAEVSAAVDEALQAEVDEIEDIELDEIEVSADSDADETIEAEPEPEPEQAAAEEVADDLELEVETDAEDEAAVDIAPATEADEAEAPEPAAEDAAVEAPEVDEEILEIFIEEASEVLETINEYLPQWTANAGDADALTEVRRAYHTLKGSGRMVGATVVGELAWSVEDMLNRVIDETIIASPELLALVAEVTARIPEGVEAFKQGAQEQFSCDDLVARAQSLASGEVEVSATEAPDAEAEEGAEETPAPAEETQATDEVEELEIVEPELPTAESEESTFELEDVSLDDEVSDETDLAEPEAPVGPDSELLEIFLEEAAERLNDIRAFAAAPVTVGEEVVAAFHTLKGSAGMADIPTVSRLGARLETLARQQFEQGTVADDFVAAAARSIELIDVILGNLPEFGQQSVEVDEFLASLEGAGEEIESAAAFSFDNIRLLSTADNVLEAWDDAQISTLRDELAEVTSQANAINQGELADVSTALLSLYEKLAARPSARVAAELAQAHEILVSMLDAIAASQSLPSSGDLVSRLETLDLTEETEADLETEAEPEPEVAVDEAQPDVPTAAPSGDVVELPADDIDPDVLPLFLEEAEEIVEQIDQSIVEWSADPTATAHLDNLLRQLHTLKGGARMGGLASLGEYTHNFETYLISVQNNDPSTFDEPFFAVVNERQDEINRRVEIYNRIATNSATAEELESMRYESAPPESVDSTPTPEAVTESAPAPAEAEQPAPASTAAAEGEVTLPEDEIDEDVLPIFLEEAEELVEGIDQSILDWSNDPSASAHLDNLLRQLHTLKGGSRMAGMASLGEFTHNLETWLISVQQNPPELNDAFFAEVNGQQDEINRRVGIYRDIAAGQASDEAIASMRTARQPGSVPADAAASVTPAAPSTPAPDVPAEAPPAEEAAKPAAAQTQQQQEMVRVASDLLEDLISLAGESSIMRGRIEQQITDFGDSLQEMEETISRVREQVRRLEIEAESRETVFRTRSRDDGDERGFDDLEMDRYTMIQEISRALNEGMSDMVDLRDTLVDKSRDAETLLHQQARIGADLQEGLTRTRMVPFARLIPRLRRIVRQISAEVGKSVRFDAYNVEGELDRTVLERIVAPLEHMLRNAVDHGIESQEKRAESGKPEQGRISLRLDREGGYVVLKISDDGGGINVDAVRSKAIERGLMTAESDLSDHEIRQFIMHAGFSTAQKLTQISGRGVGMDVVVSEIKALGGEVEIDSTFGVGTEFTIRLPFTVSINRALMVVIQDEVFAIPLNTIEGIVRVSPYELEAYYQPEAPMFEYAGQPYRLSYMGLLLDKAGEPALEGQVAPLPVILARSGDHAVALQVDRVIGSREVVVKSLGPQFGEVGGVSGATVLGDGSVVIILDVMALVRRADLAPVVEVDEKESAPAASDVKKVLIVDDSVTVRKVTSRLMERQGWEVATAKDGLDAMNQLQEIYPNIVLLDIEMPKMDGFEVLSAVRRDDRLKELPIIMITSRTGEKHQQRALELGVNRFLGKPFQEANLMSTIDEVLSETQGG